MDNLGNWHKIDDPKVTTTRWSTAYRDYRLKTQTLVYAKRAPGRGSPEEESGPEEKKGDGTEDAKESGPDEKKRENVRERGTGTCAPTTRNATCSNCPAGTKCKNCVARNAEPPSGPVQEDLSDDG